jgi:phage baseplate assembly protein W
MSSFADPKAFQGIGWSFPPCVESDGSTAVAKYEEDIRQAIRIILSTDRGERVMRPDFGAGLREFVFEPLNQTTCQKVQARVRDALVEWEPRITVKSVDVRIEGTTKNLLLIVMTYVVRTTNTLQNLVYPFYLLEGSPQ